MRKRIFAPISTLTKRTRDINTSPQLVRAIAFRNIIARIGKAPFQSDHLMESLHYIYLSACLTPHLALYPLVSCIINLLSIATALHSTISGGIHNVTDYNILLLSRSFFSSISRHFVHWYSIRRFLIWRTTNRLRNPSRL
jgi:hypothetical protein